MAGRGRRVKRTRRSTVKQHLTQWAKTGDERAEDGILNLSRVEKVQTFRTDEEATRGQNDRR